MRSRSPERFHKEIRPSVGLNFLQYKGVPGDYTDKYLDYINSKNIVNPDWYNTLFLFFIILYSTILVGKSYQCIHDKVHTNVIDITAHQRNAFCGGANDQHISEIRWNKRQTEKAYGLAYWLI